MKTAEQRFWEKVGPHDDPKACWLWLAHSTKSASGARYGQFRVYHAAGGQVLAHRFAYELLVGPIPEGLTLDHVKARGCTSTLCVNPVHLEPVTVKVNTLRGNTFQAANVKKTHCPKGHLFNEENTHVYFGHRKCRACNRARYHEKKACYA